MGETLVASHRTTGVIQERTRKHRRRGLHFALLAITAAIYLMLTSPIALAKDYHFSNVDIEVYVQPDGSFNLVEKRTYDFSGDFHWADYKLYTQGAKDITNFQISEGDQTFQETYTEAPGTVQITKTDSETYTKWFYEASNQKRTFTIKYHAIEGIKVYEDVTEFYWKFIGSEWSKRTDHITATLHLPDGALKGQIRAWGHGPLQGNVKIVDAKTVKYEISNLPAYTFVEGRATFPPKLIPQTPYISPGKRLPSILKEENKWARETNLKRWMYRIGNVVGILLPFLALVLGFILWQVYGKEYPKQYEGDYYRELPQEYEPAIAGYLWNFGNVNMNDLVATIMDLAQRGFLKIKEESKVKSGLFGTKTDYDYILERLPKEDAPLKLFEQELLSYLFETIGTSNNTPTTVSMDQIETYAKHHTHSFQSFVNKWQNQVKAQAKTYAFVEKTGTYMMFVNIAIGVSVVIVGVFLLVNGIFAGVLDVFLGILQAAFSGLFRRRSKEGALQFQQWDAFRKFLLDFSNLKEAIPASMQIWEHYLVYAVTLGVASEVIKQLKIVMPQIQDTAYMGPAWFETSRGLEGLSSLDSLNGSFSNMITTTTSAMSSGSGSGGGFSGGGGGGGGGGAG